MPVLEAGDILNGLAVPIACRYRLRTFASGAMMAMARNRVSEFFNELIVMFM
jgi:hypothetical protein